ncbi:MAG TPA: sulfurtransferase TusA family protein [Caldithrix abyssi]|uniref:Sulfurtransferase TusA family protein n=1 Tax=Caldithrix abyssi TaxID=187145 RepID=A0A7V5RQI9_CALAY|nr:sulfurtransferase TusA family protein [Caldithrix abyssi]
MSDVQANMELDCRGLNCPLPILKTKKAIETLNTGDVLKMVATDPGSINDMTAWTKRTGNELLSHEESGDEYVFFIRKK